MRHIISILFWLGAGFTCHYFLIGSEINWSNAYDLATILAWPLFLILAFLTFFIWLAVGVAAVVVAILIFVAIMNHLENREADRQLNKMRKEVRDKMKSNGIYPYADAEVIDVKPTRRS